MTSCKTTEQQIEPFGTVIFRVHPRARRMILRVNRDGKVQVTLPRYVTRKKGKEFVLRNSSYIREQQARMKNSQKRYQNGDMLGFGDYSISFTNGSPAEIYLCSKELKVVLPEGEDRTGERVQKWIEAAVKKLEKEYALSILPERVAAMAQKQGFQYGRLTIRQQKTRWGSCSSGNHLSLNARLVSLPDYLCDYVILHELVHTHHKNHGPLFWECLLQREPRAREYARELRKYSL